jgi:regulator of protease activity HflC (stomatin/prohibitin superfamily)
MWTDDRFTKEYFITAYRGDPAENTSESVPANLAVARLNVRYQVKNAGTYLGAQMEPDKYVELLSRRALVHYLATHDFSESLAAGPGRIGTGLSTALEPLLAKAGIRVVAVELTSLQPPAAAASGFRLVLDAEAASERELIEARFHEAKATAEARQMDARIRAAAAVENVRLTRLAEVDRQNFDLHLEYFHKYPELYTTRVVMDAMEEWLVDVRKIVIAAESDHEVFTLELRESQPNLLDAFRSQ